MEDKNNLDLTQHIDLTKEKDFKAMFDYIVSALEEKEYKAYDQIVGYLITGDPSYIPRYKDCRNMIKEENREDIVKYLLKTSLKKNE